MSRLALVTDEEFVGVHVFLEFGAQRLSEFIEVARVGMLFVRGYLFEEFLANGIMVIYCRVDIEVRCGVVIFFLELFFRYMIAFACEVSVMLVRAQSICP